MIEQALVRSAELDARGIGVKVEGSKVILEGLRLADTGSGRPDTTRSRYSTERQPPHKDSTSLVEAA